MERPNITTKSLRDASVSEESKRNTEDFNSALRTGLVVVKRCADSRLVLPKTALEVSSISGGGPRSPFSDLLRSQSVRGIVMLSHHDGTTVQPGSIPSGCGGREGFIGKDEADCMEEGTRRFLKQHVWSADPFKQSLIGASFSSERAGGKPALAATMDHLDLSVYPTGYVAGPLTISPVPIHRVLAPEYFPVDLYQNGIPILEDTERYLNEELKVFLNNAVDISATYRDKYRLSTMQNTQNPHTVILTTEMRSPRWRFPLVFDPPGSFFQLSLARTRLNDGSIYIDEGYASIALDQVRYPLENFSNARTLIVETRTIDMSVAFAATLLEGKYVQEWFGQDSNQILLLETSRGQTTYLDVFQG